MQFDYTIKQEGQHYILHIAGVGQKQITDLNTVHEQAILYIEATRNMLTKDIKLNFVNEIDDRIISKHTPNKGPNV